MATDYDGAIWKPAVYFTWGRSGYDILGVVLHIAEASTMSSVDNTFTGGNYEVSTHYCVDDNSVHQYVQEAETAWAVGNWVGNRQTISIELVGTTANPPSRATLDRAAALLADISRRRGLGLYVYKKNWWKHKDFSSTSCPSTADVEYAYNKANQLLSATPVVGKGDDGSMEFILQPNRENKQYWWDGSALHYLPYTDNVKAVMMAYRACYGKEIPSFGMGTPEAPWGARFQQAIHSAEIQMDHSFIDQNKVGLPKAYTQI